MAPGPAEFVFAETVSPPLSSIRNSTGSSALFLGWWSLTRHRLPDLREEETVVSFPMVSGFESLLRKLAEDLVVAGTPVDAENGLLSAFGGHELSLLYPIPIPASPSPPVAVTPEIWACLLRPLPEGPGREAEVILVETQSRRVLHREPLGRSTWYPGNIAGGDGWLLATVQCEMGGHTGSRIRAFRVKPRA